MGSRSVRTCIGCNARVVKSELIRYVWQEGVIVADYGQRLPGRGAYHCNNKQCEQRFKKNRKRLGRAFRLA